MLSPGAPGGGLPLPSLELPGGFLRFQSAQLAGTHEEASLLQILEYTGPRHPSLEASEQFLEGLIVSRSNLHS
jgi:hypothetical protein